MGCLWFFKHKKQQAKTPSKLPLSVKEVIDENLEVEKPSQSKEQEQKQGVKKEHPESLLKLLKPLTVKEPGPVNQKKEVEKTVKTKTELKELPESFFSNFLRFIMSKDLDEATLKDLLSHDFVQKMKLFHEALSNGRFAFVHEEDVKTALGKALRVLEDLELEWLERKKAYDKAFEALTDIESKIDEKVAEVKALLSKAALIRKLKSEKPKNQWFYCVNGWAFRNVFELRAALPDMPEWVFAHHCNDLKNDFAEWVRNVFEAPELASKMFKAKTKQELMAVLSEI
ncbi:hypothetical protein J7L02_02640 [Candidatus Woesearchaeota archaeon]|nr:hypothetical protein [Candidatus Woesearchaeota archaeon]